MNAMTAWMAESAWMLSALPIVVLLIAGVGITYHR